jgi:hypothetical protein
MSAAFQVFQWVTQAFSGVAKSTSAFVGFEDGGTGTVAGLAAGSAAAVAATIAASGQRTRADGRMGGDLFGQARMKIDRFQCGSSMKPGGRRGNSLFLSVFSTGCSS